MSRVFRANFRADFVDETKKRFVHLERKGGRYMMHPLAL
jgi:hypothetical protein